MAADRRKAVPKVGKDYVNPGEDDQMAIIGYHKDILRTSITWIFIFVTAGLLRLFFFWIPRLLIKATCVTCSLSEAEIVVLKDEYDQWFVSRVQKVTQEKETNDEVPSAKQYVNGSQKPETLTQMEVVRFFITKKVKYIWDKKLNIFQKLKGIEDNVSCNFFHQQQGLSYANQCRRRVTYGTNSIAIHVTPIVRLLFKEVLSPFYIFQIFSCTLWYVDNYMWYASCIVFISFVSITATIYQTRKMQRALRNTIQSSSVVTVCQNENEYRNVPSEVLVPGDVIEIPRSGCIMQCDAVLVTGNCIVNESMLTGESVPVTKTPLPNPKTTHEDSVIHFNIKDHARHVLFCGTHVIQTRYYAGQKVRAVVFRTGFSTAKGELVRSILYPKPVDFRFNRDTYYFIGVLAFFALIGFVYTVILMVKRDAEVSDIVIRALDLITITVPPALPAALSVGIVFAQRRLKFSNIFCISPRSINVCGCINTVCFDKTGTLTQDGLDMQGVVPVDDGKFQPEICDLRLIPRGHLLAGMATCHSLTIIDGVLSGDPLELVMFDSVGWELLEPGPEDARFDMICPTIVRPKSVDAASTILIPKDQVPTEEIGIIRQFTFSSSLQRMSVIIRKLDSEHFDIYTKGAPEMIASLCVTDTVPDDFQNVLMSYTLHGYRVLALAYKHLPDKLKYTKIQRIQREQVERGLTFLGLIVMENRLKPETTYAIKTLKDAMIRNIMVTGDNMLTALSVARECGLVEPDQPIYLVQAYPHQTDQHGNPISAAYVEYVSTIKELDDKHDFVKNKSDVDIELGKASRKYHFALTGKSWAILRQYFPDIIKKIVVRGTVFARMSPDQKAQLVESLQDLGYYVGMCGDGANDCGALKAAHAGISLSEAEASVASPFTSKVANISCVPTVIREGRAALVTSFGIFKYMACYSLTQFISVCILYWVGVNLTDFEFLFVDLALLTSLSITFGRTRAHTDLSANPPLVNLLSLTPVLSLILHVFVICAFQIFFFVIIQQEPWFVPWEENPDADSADSKNMSYENTAVYYSSAYQYIILAIVFSKGKPYRATMFTNPLFITNLALCYGLTLWINIYPIDGMVEFFELMPPQSINYRLIFVGAGVINFLVALALEMFIIESKLLSVTLQGKLQRILPGGKCLHEEIAKDIAADTYWPPTKTEELASLFKRMDSAYLSISESNLTDVDNLSFSESDSSSIHACEMVKEEDKQLLSEMNRSTNTYTNDAFECDYDEVDNSFTRL